MPAYPEYALIVEFMAYTGLRAADIAGLDVGDLIFAPGPKCTVKVVRTKDRKRGAWDTGTPKSKKSRRTVPLPRWLAERMADYLKEHPRADEPTAPLWPSRKNGGGYRVEGQRYAVPLDWSQPLAMGAFYDTIFRPALVAVGLPATRTLNGGNTGRARYSSARSAAHVRGFTAVGRRPLHAGVEVVGAQHVYADARRIRRLHPRGGRRCT